VSAGAAAGIPAPPAGLLAPQRRAELALWAIVGLGLLATLAGVHKGIPAPVVLGAFVIPLTFVAFQRVLLAWQTMLTAILLVILFIPIRRYTVAIGGPVELEPYRILIALILGAWFLALAADPSVKWRATGFGAPVALVWIAI